MIPVPEKRMADSERTGCRDRLSAEDCIQPAFRLSGGAASRHDAAAGIWMIDTLGEKT